MAARCLLGSPPLPSPETGLETEASTGFSLSPAAEAAICAGADGKEGEAEEAAKALTADELNQLFIQEGARTLAFSSDTRLYWKGLAPVLGSIPAGSDLMERMRLEHCEAVDRDHD